MVTHVLDGSQKASWWNSHDHLGRKGYQGEDDGRFGGGIHDDLNLTTMSWMYTSFGRGVWGSLGREKREMDSSSEQIVERRES